MLIRKDPTLTLFNSTGTIMRDLGTTVKVMVGDRDDLEWVDTMIQQTAFTQVRLFVVVEDTFPATESDGSSHWTSSGFLASDETTRLFAAMVDKGYKIALAVPPPASWLDSDGVLVGSGNIVSYANYLLGAVSYFRGVFGSKLIGIEAFPEPTLADFGRIAPSDLVSLVQHMRVQAGLLSVPLVPIIGPSTDLQATNKANDVWIQSFSLYPKLLDVWGVNIKEPLADSSIVSVDDFTARSYVGRQATLASTQIQVIAFEATKMATNLTCGHPTSERRLVDNLAGAMKNAFSSYMIESLRGFGNGDSHALMDANGMWTVYGQVTKLLTAHLPLPGLIYSPEEMNKDDGGDETLKFLVTSPNGSEMTFVLSRPSADGLDGSLKLRVMNPLMSSAYEAFDISVLAYPATTDLAAVTTRVTMGYGYATFALSHLPYDCVLIVKSKIKVKETPSGPEVTPPHDDGGTVIVNPPNPFPDTPNALLETIIQVPVVFGVPTSTDYVNGTVYYNLKTHKLMCWDDGAWVAAVLLPHE